MSVIKLVLGGGTSWSSFCPTDLLHVSLSNPPTAAGRRLNDLTLKGKQTLWRFLCSQPLFTSNPEQPERPEVVSSDLCTHRTNIRILYLKSETERRHSLHFPGISDTRRDYTGIIPICHAEFVHGLKKRRLSIKLKDL